VRQKSLLGPFFLNLIFHISYFFYDQATILHYKLSISHYKPVKLFKMTKQIFLTVLVTLSFLFSANNLQAQCQPNAGVDNIFHC